MYEKYIFKEKDLVNLEEFPPKEILYNLTKTIRSTNPIIEKELNVFLNYIFKTYKIYYVQDNYAQLDVCFFYIQYILRFSIYYRANGIKFKAFLCEYENEYRSLSSPIELFSINISESKIYLLNTIFTGYDFIKYISEKLRYYKKIEAIIFKCLKIKIHNIYIAYNIESKNSRELYELNYRIEHYFKIEKKKNTYKAEKTVPVVLTPERSVNSYLYLDNSCEDGCFIKSHNKMLIKTFVFNFPKIQHYFEICKMLRKLYGDLTYNLTLKSLVEIIKKRES